MTEKAFLYLQVTKAAAGIAYDLPLIKWVKTHYPDAAVLDADLQSDEITLHYARRLLQQNSRTIVCFKVEAPDVPITGFMPLLEEMLQPQEQQLVLLWGEHSQLQRIFQARPQLQFKIYLEEEEVQEEIKSFYAG
ncbi:hypothetical protein [Pontibacter harenae]|uniref:hypothetical protein n=1 Tax=Pontibacter harenae TaxID=2894083 RepID=UPI001E3E405E|nr:hypothetical protein [Pontibacter harenae]MCC9168786.1 hypothetical protein [Pontibacter harenae]